MFVEKPVVGLSLYDCKNINKLTKILERHSQQYRITFWNQKTSSKICLSWIPRWSYWFQREIEVSADQLILIVKSKIKRAKNQLGYDTRTLSCDWP